MSFLKWQKNLKKSFIINSEVTMENNQEIILKIKDILVSRNEKVSIAESLTAGLLQAAFGEVSGISECFEGGISTYSLRSKVNQLGVNEEHAIKTNCVSSVVAMEMAKGVSELFDTDLTIATTGYAEPYPSKGIIYPIAHICVTYKGICTHKKVVVKDIVGKENARNIMRSHVVNEALKMALSVLNQDYKNIIHM
jgi:nicotinamide-nucleotide amidase